MKKLKVALFALLFLLACKDDDVPDGLKITSANFIDDLLFVDSNNFQIETSEPATFSTIDPVVQISSTGIIYRITSAEVVAINVVSKSDVNNKLRIYALGVKDDNYDHPNLDYNGPPATQAYDSYLKGWKTLQNLPVNNETYALVLRHADADQGADYNLEHQDAPPNWWKSCDPAFARQLNEKGRKRAVELGNIFRDLNYPIARVISSEFCRAKETASLINAGPPVVTDGRLNHLDYNVSYPNGIFSAMIAVMKEQPVDNQMTLIEAHHPMNELRTTTMAGFPTVAPFPWTGGYLVKVSPDKTVTFEGAVSWGMFKYWRDKKLERL
jgi:phosphohistidine phosphatase SixA